MISLPLLQKIIPTIKSSSERESIITLAIIIGVIGLTILTGYFSRKGSSKSGSTDATKKVSKRTFIKKALSVGLSKNEAHFLKNIISIQELNNPLLVFSRQKVLDSVLKNGIAYFENEDISEDELANIKVVIFRIKEKLFGRPEKEGIQRSTSTLGSEQDIILRIQNVGSFKTTIYSNKKHAIYIVNPVSSDNRLIKIKSGTLVRVSYWKKNDQEYSFVTKVIGYKEINDTSCALLQHTNKVTKTKQRKYKRKTIEKPVYFYPVSYVTVGIGRKAKQKAVVHEKSATLGTMINISTGGCCIRTSKPAALSTLIKIKFQTDTGEPVWCFGKVIKTTSNFGIEATMNINFTKITKPNLIAINSFVYDF